MTAETQPSRPTRRPRLHRRRAQMLGALVIILIGTALAWWGLDYAAQIPITLDVNGQEHHFRTRADTVQAALDEAGLLLDPEDVVWPSLDSGLKHDMTITVRKASAVALQVGQSVRQVRTQSADPLEVLSEQGIAVGPDDRVQVDGQEYTREQIALLSWKTPPTSIRVIAGVTLTVVDGEHTLDVTTTQIDVGRALDAAGLKLYLADQVIPALSTPVSTGMVVQIQRAVPIVVQADGQRLETRAVGPTVGDALQTVGIAPVGLDYTVPSLETLLEPGMVIQVVRVSEELVTHDEPIPFDTIYQLDSTLALNEKRVIQEGANGLRTREFRVRYEDGAEVSRVVEQEWIMRDPTPRMIAYGERVKSP